LKGLEEPGALVFTPPDVHGMCFKIHVCVGCFDAVLKDRVQIAPGAGAVIAQGTPDDVLKKAVLNQPHCATCKTPMEFRMWDRPGGIPGNGWGCPKCNPMPKTKGRCNFCREEGRTSKVYPGPSSQTAVAWQPFYDEEGVFHNKDPNKRTTHYTCSNGHEWSETTP
jgi:hypothetical protein